MTNNTPTIILMRYGQNKPILLPNHALTEKRNFFKGRDYHHIKSFTFSIATCIGNVSLLAIRPHMEKFLFNSM